MGCWTARQRVTGVLIELLSINWLLIDYQEGLVVLEERSIKECSSFHLNWPEIESAMSVTFARKCIWLLNALCRLNHRMTACSVTYAQRMPNQDRIIADGLEWECPPIIPFIDDVSGNSTKQWNVHYCSYASNAALPRSEIEKEANIHFVVTSPHASPMELIQAICDAIKCVLSHYMINTNLLIVM